MANDLPEFRYHPDPIATGSIVPSEETCECCGKERGYVCCATPSGEKDIDFVCPWCVADGTANAKLGAFFSDSWPLSQANISREIIDEVTCRTPGYISWQQDSWMACCEDACEFHGDADKKELAALDEDARSRVARDFELPVEQFEEMLKYYTPKGSPAIYKFRCRHCGIVRFNWDCA